MLTIRKAKPDAVVMVGAYKSVAELIKLSRNSDDLTSVSTNIATSLADLRKAILDRPQAEFIAALAQVSGTLATSLQSRGRVFEYSARIGAMNNGLQQLSTDLQSRLLQTADDAYFNISINGEEMMVDLVVDKFTAL